MGVFAELGRRNVIRVGVAYLVFTWLVLQVLDVMAPIMGLPDWIGRALLLVLALGLPPALFLSWAYELTPGGIRRTREVTQHESITRQTGRRLDWAVLALLVATLGLFGWQRLHPVDPARRPVAGPAATRPAPAPASRGIAVLPFRDMSPGRDQGWFADGLTEEILNSLARLPGLMVTARTSAFAFRDSDRPVPEIARALGVAHVVEGSVRRDGDKLRVTAQLIRAADGFHLWSQSYDRGTADALAVQQDIAGNVARMLDVYLDDAERERMFASGTHDPDAFDAFLRSRELFARAHREDFGLLWDANALLEQALRHDPRYARAHYNHHDAYAHTLMGDIALSRAPAQDGKPATIATLTERMRLDLDAAVATAPDPVTRLGYEFDRAFVLGDWMRLPGLVRRLEQLDDVAAGELVSGGWFPDTMLLLDRPGPLQRYARAALRRDPLDPRLWFWLAETTRRLGRPQEALAILRTARERGVGHPLMAEGEALAALDDGRPADALATIIAVPPEERRPWFDPLQAVLLHAAGREAEARDLASAIQAREPENEMLVWVYAELGEQEEAERIASLVDASPRLSAMRFARLYDHADGLPLDLAAAPRLAARVQAAGLHLRPHRSLSERSGVR